MAIRRSQASTSGSSFMSPAPLSAMNSSAGWNKSFTVIVSSSSIFFKSLAVPSNMVICVSCPQACIQPSFSDFHATSESSVTGSASISARMPSTFPAECFPATVAITPVLQTFT